MLNFSQKNFIDINRCVKDTISSCEQCSEKFTPRNENLSSIEKMLEKYKNITRS